ncbi:MAG: hypothetical protein IKN27_03170 [Selenomonadaceae bacterium]|nr:hypothetical protein [Selenomonadaceae bacterium]
MTEQEIINVDVQSRVSNLETKFEAFMQEMRYFKTEMRQQNEMRANEIRDLQKKHDEEQAKREIAQAKHDADMKEMNQRFYAKFDAMDAKIDSKFDKLSDQLHTMTIAAVVGFGAIAVAIGGLVVSALK